MAHGATLLEQLSGQHGDTGYQEQLSGQHRDIGYKEQLSGQHGDTGYQEQLWEKTETLGMVSRTTVGQHEDTGYQEQLWNNTETLGIRSSCGTTWRHWVSRTAVGQHGDTGYQEQLSDNTETHFEDHILHPLVITRTLRNVSVWRRLCRHVAEFTWMGCADWTRGRKPEAGCGEQSIIGR